MLISKSSNIMIDTVTVNKCGHDGVYAYHVNGITVKNSKFINRTNSSVRFDSVTDGVVQTMNVLHLAADMQAWNYRELLKT